MKIKLINYIKNINDPYLKFVLEDLQNDVLYVKGKTKSEINSILNI